MERYCVPARAERIGSLRAWLAVAAIKDVRITDAEGRQYTLLDFAKAYLD